VRVELVRERVYTRINWRQRRFCFRQDLFGKELGIDTGGHTDSLDPNPGMLLWDYRFLFVSYRGCSQRYKIWKS